MKTKLFKSNRNFTLFDFIISHGQLLLRSNKNEIETNNIDIIFYNVKYLQVISSYQTISIKIIDDYQNIISYNDVSSFLYQKDNYLFEIESSNEKFYVAASYFIVYENELEFNETSLGLHQNKERGKKLASSLKEIS